MDKDYLKYLIEGLIPVVVTRNHMFEIRLELK